MSTMAPVACSDCSFLISSDGLQENHAPDCPRRVLQQVAVEANGRLLAWISGRLYNPMNGGHGHWSVSAGRRRSWRERTQLCVSSAMRQARWNRPDRAPKVIVMTAFVWNLFDEDGLSAALKPVVDGLRDAKVIHDDSPRSGHRFVRRQQVNRKHRGVEVVIEPRREAKEAT